MLFESKRLKFRLFSKKDKIDLIKILNDEVVTKWAHLPYPYTEKHADWWIDTGSKKKYHFALEEKNKKQLWIPEGFAHGFLALENNSEVLYKASNLWNKEQDRSIRWDDKYINICCQLKDIGYSEPRLSEKDAKAPFINNADLFK